MFLQLLASQLLNSVLVFWPQNFIVFLGEFWANLKYGFKHLFTQVRYGLIAYESVLIGTSFLIGICGLILMMIALVMYRNEPLGDGSQWVIPFLTLCIWHALLTAFLYIILATILLNVLYAFFSKNKSRYISGYRFYGVLVLYIICLGIIFGTFTQWMQEINAMITAIRNEGNRSFLTLLLFLVPGGLVYPELVKHVVSLFANPLFCMQLIACADLVTTQWRQYTVVTKIALWIGLLPCMGVCYMMYCVLWKLHALISSSILVNFMGAGIIVLELPLLPILLGISVIFLYTFYARQEQLIKD
ncbi:MAG: hypothetical protein WCE21_04105 [Candidatus Babeliales bacterium]